MRFLWSLGFSALLGCSILVGHCDAQDRPLVKFDKHVQPILEQRCLSCHGAEEAKNDFRVDDRESLIAYIQPGDADSSTLWTDYLNTDDLEMLMPPASDSQPAGLAIGELLVIKTWIDQGAEGNWVSGVGSKTSEKPAQTPTNDLEKWWAFQGLFHPATVHFPVALLTVSALFVFLSFFNRDSCEPVAYHCLWIGGLGAAVACAAGWSYATYKGYTGVSFDFQNSGIDRHRWAGVFVAVFAFLLIPLARNVRHTGSLNNRIIWLLASILLAGGVSLAGYQGGELTYGEDHYMKYFQKLFPSVQDDDQVVEPEQSSTSETPTGPDGISTGSDLSDENPANESSEPQSTDSQASSTESAAVETPESDSAAVEPAADSTEIDLPPADNPEAEADNKPASSENSEADVKVNSSSPEPAESGTASDSKPQETPEIR